MRLSLHLNDVTIEQGLSKIAKAIGTPGHAVITDASKKEARVLIFDSGAGGPDLIQKFKPADLQEEKPSLTQWRALSQDELEAI